MEAVLKTAQFEIRYKESRVETDLLWESHCHTQYEAISVLEGDILIMQEGITYRLPARQTAIIPPLSYHTVTANKRSLYRRVTTLFDRDAIPPPIRDRFTPDASRAPVILSDHGKRLMRALTASDPQFYAPLSDSILVDLLYRYAEDEHIGTVSEADATLQRILSYIDAHPTEQIRIADIAAHTALSASSVSHLFQKHMQISPKQYILEKRLALAKSLIQGGMPPTLAAIHIGYDNYSNFYRLYKKHFGVSPAESQTAK
jgi:AraC-like DNA-binding protein